VETRKKDITRWNKSNNNSTRYDDEERIFEATFERDGKTTKTGKFRAEQEVDRERCESESESEESGISNIEDADSLSDGSMANGIEEERMSDTSSVSEDVTLDTGNIGSRGWTKGPVRKIATDGDGRVSTIYSKVPHRNGRRLVSRKQSRQHNQQRVRRNEYKDRDNNVIDIIEEQDLHMENDINEMENYSKRAFLNVTFSGERVGDFDESLHGRFAPVGPLNQHEKTKHNLNSTLGSEFLSLFA